MAKGYNRKIKEKDVEMDNNIEKEIEEVIEEVADEVIIEEVAENPLDDDSINKIVDKLEEVPKQRTKQLTESFVEKKIKDIENSRMPEYQKREYIKSLLPKVEEEGVSFSVYAKLRGLSSIITDAMKFYPKVVKTDKASLEQWDKLLIDF